MTVWKLSSFSYCPRKEGFTGMFKWWTDIGSWLMTKGVKEQVGLLAHICWNIWTTRNRLIFEGIKDNPLGIWHKALKEAAKFNESVEVECLTTSNFGSHWSALTKAVLKLTSWRSSKKLAGIAAFARDRNGRII
ncbi:hypothetical protein Goshw_013717 [Gossypium schwendimanii]|uniref:Reverse transcriptase zinc-binding domain-containing protein n=1 Tax=Gossypium schwendimanii TaxID=34291 RepID=A0A7J9N2Y2_GOSSC|nr:hypothetical protein [Gossypium schwendimanii]